MQPKKLENYKFFQPIAWTLCISFAGFVGMMAINLSNQVQRFEDTSLSFEHRLQNVEAALGTNQLPE